MDPIWFHLPRTIVALILEYIRIDKVFGVYQTSKSLIRYVSSSLYKKVEVNKRIEAYHLIRRTLVRGGMHLLDIRSCKHDVESFYWTNFVLRLGKVYGMFEDRLIWFSSLMEGGRVRVCISISINFDLFVWINDNKTMETMYQGYICSFKWNFDRSLILVCHKEEEEFERSEAELSLLQNDR